jgi:hypothetical protein
MYVVWKVNRFSFSGAHTVFCQIFCCSPFVITVLFLMRRLYLSYLKCKRTKTVLSQTHTPTLLNEQNTEQC